MPKIEGIRIRNYKALKDIASGKLWNSQASNPLKSMTVVIGKNGVGKSTLYDAFGFLYHCLRSGVEEACDLHERGGFKRICTLGSSAPISFEIYFKQEEKA